MKGQFKIERLFAFIMIDKDGTEGIVGSLRSDGSWMPLIGADSDRVDSLRPLAAALAKQHQSPIVLALFSQREDKEVIGGDSAH